MKGKMSGILMQGVLRELKNYSQGSMEPKRLRRADTKTVPVRTVPYLVTSAKSERIFPETVRRVIWAQLIDLSGLLPLISPARVFDIVL